MTQLCAMHSADYVVHMLANRLQRRAVLSNPTHAAEIHAQRINRPVVVLGLFRSGTTALHRILSAMPTLRGIKYYELMYFAGLHGHNVSAGAYADRSQDPRLPVVEAYVGCRAAGACLVHGTKCSLLTQRPPPIAGKSTNAIHLARRWLSECTR